MIDSSACIPVQKLLPIVLHSEPDRQSGYSQYCGGLPSKPIRTDWQLKLWLVNLKMKWSQLIMTWIIRRIYSTVIVEGNLMVAGSELHSSLMLQYDPIFTFIRDPLTTPIVIYSSDTKSSIFCFAQLHLQILVNYQNQGQFWNLLILRIPKLKV